MATQPDLGIKDPYALDEKQLDAAVDLLKKQSENVGEYWSDYLKATQAIKNGSSVVGTTWQVIANLAQSEKAPVAVDAAEGGLDRVVRHLDGGREEQAQDLCLQADRPPGLARRPTPRSRSTSVRRPPTSWPARRRATRTTATTYHAEDEDYFSKVYYWNTPITACLDGRTDVKCTDYAEWTKKWSEIRG